jgi:hypothetical protein
MTEDQDLEAKRAAARLAMGGEAYAKKIAAQNLDLAKKRREAMIAMESLEQRARREAKEKETIDQANAQKKLEIDLQEAKKREVEKQAKLEAEKQAQAEAKMNAAKINQAEFETKQNLIEDLKKSGMSKISPLRTLKTDLEQSVQTENLSAVKISLMENERKQKDSVFVAPQNTTPQKKTWTIVLSVILIISSFVLVSGVFYFNQNRSLGVAPVTINSLIFADENQALALDQKSSLEIINTIRQLKNLLGPKNSLLNIYPTKTVATTSTLKAKTIDVGLPEFLDASRINLSAEITRHLDSPFMIGAYRSDNNQLFWVFSVNDLEYTKAAILKDEKAFLNNLLGPFLVDTTFSTDLSQAQILDQVVKNKDARVVKNSQAVTIAAYSFLDRQTLVVTQNEAALGQIIDSFNTPRP